MFFGDVDGRLEFILLAFLLLSTSLLAKSLAASPSPLILENTSLRAEFDADSGALIGFQNIATGWRAQDRAKLGRSFEMIVPIPDRRDNRVQANKNRLDHFELSEDKRSVKFVWKRLQSEHAGILDISFECMVTLSEDGLSFRPRVVNHSPYAIETIKYPELGDVPVPHGELKFRRASLSYGNLLRAGLFPEFIYDPGYWGVDNPTQFVRSTNEQLFILLEGEKQGLFGLVQDPSLRQLVAWTIELQPGYESSLRGIAPAAREINGSPVHYSFSAIHYPFAAPGESAQLSPILLRPYAGDWHSGVDLYKKWRNTWFHQRANIPEWVKRVHSWQQININSSEDDLRVRYKDLVGVGEEAAKFDVGAIQITGWNRGGQDRGNPTQDTDDRLGTRQEFQSAISSIQKMGVNVILFSKYTWADVTTDAYKQALRALAAQDPYGDPYMWSGYQYQTPTQLADMNTRRFAAMCSASPKWRETATREFQKLLDYGAAGMLYDEVEWHGPAQYCFASDHGHRVPASLFEGDIPLAEQFHEVAEIQNPNFVFAGEAPTDVESQYYYVSYLRIGSGHVAADRYIDPFKPIVVAVVGYDDREMINNCLMDRYILSYEPRNFKGRLSEFPLTVSYGQKVDGLRRKYKEYLWDAEFRDTLGASVEVDGKPYPRYSVFGRKESGRRAVVVVNDDTQKPMEAEIKLEGSPGPLNVVSPEDLSPRVSSGKVTVAPRSAVVILEGLEVH